MALFLRFLLGLGSSWQITAGTTTVLATSSGTTTSGSAASRSATSGSAGARTIASWTETTFSHASHHAFHLLTRNGSVPISIDLLQPSGHLLGDLVTLEHSVLVLVPHSKHLGEELTRVTVAWRATEAATSARLIGLCRGRSSHRRSTARRLFAAGPIASAFTPQHRNQLIASYKAISIDISPHDQRAQALRQLVGGQPGFILVLFILVLFIRVVVIVIVVIAL